MLKKTITAVVALAAGLILNAQSFTVRGVVTTSDGAPAIGATVIETGTSNVVLILEDDGSYSISVSNSEASLTFSLLGTKEQVVPVNSRTKIDICLEFDSETIADAVVTAFGIKRDAKSLGYSVVSVDSKDLFAGREQNAVMALSGKVPGVDISTGSGGAYGSTRVVIRGSTSLTGSQQPLYVVDGIPVIGSSQSTIGSNANAEGIDYGDFMSSLDPETIESISVLKGASASALYGSAASNGVILITTKGADKNDKGWSVDFSTSFSATSLMTRLNDYQREYGMGSNGFMPANVTEARDMTLSAWGAPLDASKTITIFNGTEQSYGNVNNNVMSFYRTGLNFNNSISVSQNSKTSSTRITVSDSRTQDIIPNSNGSRTQIAFKNTLNLGKRFTVDTQATYSIENVKNRPTQGNGAANIGYVLLSLPANFDQAWLGEGYKGSDGSYTRYTSNETRINPYWVINEMENTSKKNRLIGAVKLNFNIIEGLDFYVKASTDHYSFRTYEYTPVHTPNTDKGKMNLDMRMATQMNYEALFKFNRRLGQFDVSAYLGGNIRTSHNETYSHTGSTEVIPGMIDITNYDLKSYGHALSRKIVYSEYAMASLGWKDAVYIEGTLRNDISSALAAEHRSYWYPSVSASVVFSNLFNLSKAMIDFLKLRASWAKVGGDTSPYQLDLTYALLGPEYTNNGVTMGWVSSTTVPYKGLKPTSTYSYEVGLEAKFFTNRLYFDLSLYTTKTVDQIMNLPISESSGYKNAIINAGVITNKGVELLIGGVPVKTHGFEWHSDLTFARNVNNVESLHPEVQNLELQASRWGQTFVYATAGQAYGSIYGYKFKRNEDGRVIVNNNGLPLYDEELSIMGNGNHDFSLGWRNTFSYKGINLSILIDAKFGAELYSQTAALQAYYGITNRTLEGREGWYASERQREEEGVKPNKWTPTGGLVIDGVVADGTDANGKTIWKENTKYINPETYYTSILSKTSEPFIYDASFIKLREISISYALPAKILKNCFIKGVSFSAYGNNLATIYSKVPNVDPESSLSSGNGVGIEMASLPARRNFGFGIKLKF